MDKELNESLKGLGLDISDERFKILKKEGDETPFEDQSFEMTFEYIPSPELNILKLNEQPILTLGNIATLVSPPGTGKSNVCEAICANGINPLADAFGFTVNLSQGRGILCIDTERTKNDINKGMNRIYSRARTYEHKDIQVENHRYKRCTVRSYKVIDDYDLCMEHLEFHIKSGKYQLVIIDQIGDFVRSVNKEEECRNIVRKLEIFAEKYDCAIFCTIHPNPKDPSFKPTGHLGTALLKKSETAMVSFKADGNKNVRLITTNFEHGKVRNAYDVVETAFEWSDIDKMFVKSDQMTTQEAVKKTSDSWRNFDNAIYLAFNEKSNWRPDELAEKMRILLSDYVKDKKTLSQIDESYLEEYRKKKGIIELLNGSYFLSKDKTDYDDVPF